MREPRAARPKFLFRGLLFLALAGVAFAIYSNTFHAPFVFDDLPNISESRHMKMGEISLQGLYDAAFKSECVNRPVANISFALNYFFHQYDVAGYHLVNILIHILSGIFLFLLIRETLIISRDRASSTLASGVIQPDAAAFFAVLLWFVHPLHTQSVTYIVQRMTSMAAMFYVLSLLCYVKGRLSSGAPRWAMYAGSLISGLLAFASKEMSATLPVFVFLYEWFFFQDLNPEWLKRKLIVFSVPAAVVAVLAFFYLGSNPLEVILSGYTKRDFSLPQRVMTEFRVILHYISLILFPYPGRLNLDYDFSLSYSLLNPPSTLLSLLVILGLLWFTMYTAKKDRIVSFAILWFFGNLVIESSVIPLELAFEHRTYLPSMFVIPLLVLAAHHHVRPVGAKVALVCVIAAVLGVWTYQRNSVWTDDVLLWGDCVQKSPNKARPRDNYGIALARKGRIDEAIAHMELAVRLDPDNWRILNNIGKVYKDLGESEKAIQSYLKAMQYNPDNIKPLLGLGSVYEERGELDKAIFYYSQAIYLDPENAGAYYRMGIVHAIKGETDRNELVKAVGYFMESLRIDPDNHLAYLELGSAYTKMGEFDKAIESYSQVIRMNPENARAYHDLGILYARGGNLHVAADMFSLALKHDPHDAGTHCSLGVVLVNLGKVGEAIDRFSEALRIDPNSQEARHYLNAALDYQKKAQ